MTYPEVPEEDSFTKKERWYMKRQKEEFRTRMKNLKHKEYQKLRIMVPSIAFKPNVSKVTVIEEAVRYIDHLHEALLTKLEEQESKTTDQTDAVHTKYTTGKGFSRAGTTALELVKKADFSLYSKLREQMQAFASKKFSLTREIEYEDDFDVEREAKGSNDRAMK